MTLFTLPTISFAVTMLFAFMLTAAIAVCVYSMRNFGYWRRKGIPYLQPIPVAGNLKDFLLFRKHIGNLLREVYIDMKDQPYVGMFFFDQPVLFVKNLPLWKSILHKDADHFEDRGFSPIKSDKIFSENLFGKKGSDARILRAKMEPAFTKGKLKRFYLLLEQKAANLDHYFDSASRDGTPCSVMSACARFTMDAVATIGFGIETRALLDDEDALYSLIRNIFRYNKIFTFVSVATFVDLPLLRMLDVSLMPKPLAQFLRRTIWGVVNERERAGLQGVRGDFLDLLMELRAKGRIAGDDHRPGDSDAPAHDATGRFEMDGDILISQAFSILSAGFDTTTTLMSCALFELAKNQDIQEKLRTQLQQEVQEHGGNLTYEALQGTNYLDMIFQETLRMYPVLPFLDRTCTKEYRIPGTDVVLDKGVFVFTSILGIQRDPKFYPEPDRFDPERFSEANKHKIPSGAYFPFGDGAHQCIGRRLGTLQGKVGVAHIILNYRIHPTAAPTEQLESDVNSFLIHPRDGVPLLFSRIEDN